MSNSFPQANFNFSLSRYQVGPIWNLSVPIFKSKQSRLPVDSAGSTSVPDASSTISISAPEATSTVQYLVGLLLSSSQVKLDVSIWDFSPSYLLQYQYQVESHCLHIKLDPSASGISSYYSVFNIKLVAQSTIYY